MSYIHVPKTLSYTKEKIVFISKYIQLCLETLRNSTTNWRSITVYARGKFVTHTHTKTYC